MVAKSADFAGNSIHANVLKAASQSTVPRRAPGVGTGLAKTSKPLQLFLLRLFEQMPLLDPIGVNSCSFAVRLFGRGEGNREQTQMNANQSETSRAPLRVLAGRDLSALVAGL